MKHLVLHSGLFYSTAPKKMGAAGRVLGVWILVLLGYAGQDRHLSVPYIPNL